MTSDKVERAPERFTPVADEEGFVYCQRHPYGAFVRLDAYDALQAERDAIAEAAFEAAAQWLIRAGIAGDGQSDPLADCIRALTTADAQNALDKMLEKAREDAIREAAALCAPKKAKVTRGNRFTPSTKNPQSAAAQAARKQCHDAILALLDQRKEGV